VSSVALGTRQATQDGNLKLNNSDGKFKLLVFGGRGMLLAASGGKFIMQARVRVDAMTEADIRVRLEEIDPSLNVQEFSGTQSSSRRKSQGMEPFTYFVIAFSAHLAAGITHEALMALIKKKFADKNPQIDSVSGIEDSAV
jgi:hypothetical protein